MSTLWGPKQPKQVKPAIKVFADSREICDLTTKGGRDEYRNRTRSIYDRQGRRCALQIHQFCKERHGAWPFEQIQFDHETGRTKSRQDDRIVIEKDGKLVPQNAAVCPWCNTMKGSRQIDYCIVP